MSDTPEQIAAEIKSEQRRMIVGDDQAYSQGVDELLRRLREAGLLREGPDVGDMLDTLLVAPDDITIAKHAIQDGAVIEWQVWDGYGETYTAQSWREALTAAYEALQEGTP